jgi:hypothetical protein
MTKILWTALFFACAVPAFAGDVGVSISVGQPGFYGQINIGNVPSPQLVYPQPVVIQPAPEFVSAAQVPAFCTCLAMCYPDLYVCESFHSGCHSRPAGCRSGCQFGCGRGRT